MLKYVLLNKLSCRRCFAGGAEGIKMTVLQYIVGSLILVLALVIIVVILMQEGRARGISGTIAGGADTFMSKNKARTIDAFLSRWTKIIAIGFFVLVIAANVITILIK